MPSRSPLDLLLSFVGVFLVTVGPVGVVTASLLPPDVSTTVLTVGGTALVSVPLAVWYWRSGRSVGDLGAFFFWVTGLSVVFGFVALSTLRVASSVTGRSAGLVPAVVGVAAVYAVAYYLVYRDGWVRLRARLGANPLVDLLLSVVGVFLVTVGPVSVVTSYAYPPDVVTTVLDVAGTALVSIPLAVWYWRSGRSVGDLGTFFFWLVALSLLVGLPAALVLAVVGPVETGSAASGFLTAAYLFVVYAGAYYLVYRGGWRRVRASLD
ncbi:MAG: hypothetical protein ABEJ22_02360 [Haloferacaceae archaeon]